MYVSLEALSPGVRQRRFGVRRSALASAMALHSGVARRMSVRLSQVIGWVARIDNVANDRWSKHPRGPSVSVSDVIRWLVSTSNDSKASRYSVGYRSEWKSGPWKAVDSDKGEAPQMRAHRITSLGIGSVNFAGKLKVRYKKRVGGLLLRSMNGNVNFAAKQFFGDDVLCLCLVEWLVG